MSLLFCHHDLFSHRALTPILSGAISGGIVGVAWIIGIIVWLYKRHRRARRAKAAGFRSYREFLDPHKTKDAFILPPDPAVVKGQARPGQSFVPDGMEAREHEREKERLEREEHWRGVGVFRHAHTMPGAEKEEGAHGRREGVPLGMGHRSAPASVPDGLDTDTTPLAP